MSDLSSVYSHLLAQMKATSEWYALKDRKMLRRYQGDIMLEFTLDYEPVRHDIRTHRYIRAQRPTRSETGSEWSAVKDH